MGALRPVELLVRDAVLRSRAPRAARQVALVVVDEEALRREEPWPWSRPRLAELTEALRRAGARGVVFDLLLPEPRDGDEALAAALRGGPAVLAVGVDDRERWLRPAPALLTAATLAHVSFETDRDGVARRFRATLQLEGRSLPALAVAGARLLDPGRPIAVGAEVRPGFACRDVPRFSAARFRDGTATAPDLTGRLVFVGATAAGIGDRVVSPVSPRGSPEPGVVVQAAACESLLQGDTLRPLPPYAAALASGLAALLAGLASRSRALAAAAALSPLPLGMALIPAARLEAPAVTAALAAFVATSAFELRAVARRRRQSAAAEARVRELSALAEELRAGRVDDAEARRVVAHELRTPLTSVRGLAQLLADYELSEEERRRVAGLLASETSRLSEMVETLLDLERMKLRDFRATAAPVALTALVERRAEVLRRGSRRELRVTADEGVTVLGDAALLERVLENLVGNAIKFSPEGSPIGLSLSHGEGEAVLEVVDQGQGIPAEDREKVFRRFARSRGAGLVPGLGLGLTFVAEIAAWHGGRADARENPGGGTILRVALPLAPGGGTAVAP